MNEFPIHHIALTVIPKVGNITAKKLIAYCGSAEAIFSAKKHELSKIPGIGNTNASYIIANKDSAIIRAEQEVEYAIKNEIVITSIQNDQFPSKLKHCEDGPIVLYTKGKINFNTKKCISIVGTRKATEYGKSFCEQLISALKPHNPIIISGLAYGIDICAHKAALKNDLATVGVLAHGLDRIYPSQHRTTAVAMQNNGGLASEFISNTNPDRENFPKRNRIIAGLSDATIVIESSKKGGSLITAELANQYNRDVFALPGKTTDSQSVGCNSLIKQHKAHLIQSIKDLEYIMGWNTPTIDQNKQTELFIELNKEEKLIYSMLGQKEQMNIDEISLKCSFPMSKTAALLLGLEFKNIIKSMPGKRYKKI